LVWRVWTFNRYASSQNVPISPYADLAITSEGGPMSKKFQATRLLLAVAAIVALAVELGAGNKFG